MRRENLIKEEYVLEVDDSDFESISSFKIKDDINRKVYDEDNKMFSYIRHQLMEIAQDFYSSTKLEANIIDIVLVGSLANYNWSSRFSDFDLHIIIDFEEAANFKILRNEDGEVPIIKQYTNYAKKIWNSENKIKVEGFDVEVYLQDSDEVVNSSGQYSILNDKWIVKPTKTNFELDEASIRLKAEPVMLEIEELEASKLDYRTLNDKIKKTWDKIKKFRSEGLATEGGELSVGNLVFKLLRRNGFIERIIKLKQKSYIKKFS